MNLVLFLLAALWVLPARAQNGLYTDPILVLEPGMHTAQINRFDIDAAGRVLATASNDKTVRVWSAEDGALLRTLRLPTGSGHVGKAFAAAISPDGALVAVGGWTGEAAGQDSVYFFDTASGRLLRRAGGLPDVAFHLTFSPDGRRLAATLGGGHGIRLIDPATGRTSAEDRDYGGSVHAAAFDRAGRLATTSEDGKVRLYDPNLRLIKSALVRRGKLPLGVAFSPDGERLAVGYADADTVDVFDPATLGWLFAADAGGSDNGNLHEVSWSADGAGGAARRRRRSDRALDRRGTRRVLRPAPRLRCGEGPARAAGRGACLFHR
jgi:WD40 repeat protein